MGVSLLRIDDRLVHGQVIEGWVKSLRVTWLIVASDSVAADDTQRALYCLAVPHGIRLECLSVVEAAQRWREGCWNGQKTLVLVSNPRDAFRLYEAGAPITSVNVGGLHFREGRVQVLKALSLDETDVRDLKDLAEKGVLLEARPLPLDEPVDVVALIARWQVEHEAMKEQPR